MASGEMDYRNRPESVETTLDLLDLVATDANMSQRGLATRLGVALGLTNAVLKRCVKKGLLKIREAPARRYAYYLTPKGFAEKSRLTAKYLSHSLNFYREARQSYADLFKYCNNREWRTVAIIGASELAEIAHLAASESGVKIAGFVDPKRNEDTFCGLPVVRSPRELNGAVKPAAVILAEITDPQRTYESLAETLPCERILAPKLLRVTRRPSPPSE